MNRCCIPLALALLLAAGSLARAQRGELTTATPVLEFWHSRGRAGCTTADGRRWAFVVSEATAHDGVGVMILEVAR